jgi:hypothetical protein
MRTWQVERRKRRWHRHRIKNAHGRSTQGCTDTFPSSVKHLIRCPRNRQQAKSSH